MWKQGALVGLAGSPALRIALCGSPGHCVWRRGRWLAPDAVTTGWSGAARIEWGPWTCAVYAMLPIVLTALFLWYCAA